LKGRGLERAWDQRHLISALARRDGTQLLSALELPFDQAQAILL